MTTRCAWGLVAAAGLAGLLALGSGARAQEEKIKLDQVPKDVMDSATAKFPGAKMREASKETEDGKTVFELSMTHEESKMDVTFEEDGTLVLVETEVAEKDLPSAVVQAAQ